MSSQIKNLPASFRFASKPPKIPSHISEDAREAPPMTKPVEMIVLNAISIPERTQNKLIERPQPLTQRQRFTSTPYPQIVLNQTTVELDIFDSELLTNQRVKRIASKAIPIPKQAQNELAERAQSLTPSPTFTSTPYPTLKPTNNKDQPSVFDLELDLTQKTEQSRLVEYTEPSSQRKIVTPTSSPRFAPMNDTALPPLFNDELSSTQTTEQSRLVEWTQPSNQSEMLTPTSSPRFTSMNDTALSTLFNDELSSTQTTEQSKPVKCAQPLPQSELSDPTPSSNFAPMDKIDEPSIFPFEL
jgi:hypothetical protein